MGNRGSVIYDRSWLEQARREQNRSQMEVAQAARTDVSNYNRVEKGLTEPGIKSGLRICDYLRLDPRRFLTEKPIGQRISDRSS